MKILFYGAGVLGSLYAARLLPLFGKKSQL